MAKTKKPVRRAAPAKKCAPIPAQVADGALPKVPQPKPSLWQRFRSAITGLFVPKAYAKAHPDTTVREKVRE